MFSSFINLKQWIIKDFVSSNLIRLFRFKNQSQHEKEKVLKQEITASKKTVLTSKLREENTNYFKKHFRMLDENIRYLINLVKPT